VPGVVGGDDADLLPGAADAPLDEHLRDGDRCPVGALHEVDRERAALVGVGRCPRQRERRGGELVGCLHGNGAETEREEEPENAADDHAPELHGGHSARPEG
jgi:hypothetical protein